jgi:hypothetical protein
LSRPIKASGDIAGPVERVKIEDMFGKCWSIPNPGPALPTIITVQAPAGIGKNHCYIYNNYFFIKIVPKKCLIVQRILPIKKVQILRIRSFYVVRKTLSNVLASVVVG